MSLLLSELILRHEGAVRRSAGPGSEEGTAAAAAAETAEFMSEANLLELLSDLVLHLPACATSIHRRGGGGVRACVMVVNVDRMSSRIVPGVLACVCAVLILVAGFVEWAGCGFVLATFRRTWHHDL